MKIGVLALQGDFREHLVAAKSAGHAALTVRRPEELEEVDALILPGGESTTIVHLAKTFNLLQPIRDRIKSGMPVYGSCAGMILLADQILDAKQGQKSFGGLDITVRRNAFGRQVDSFESDISFDDGLNELIRAVFIRAPWVEKVSDTVQVLASIDNHPVAVRSKTALATSFHPEITGDNRIHRYFIEQVARPVLQKVK